MGPAEMHCSDDGGVGFAFLGRSRCCDAGNARHRGREDRHMRRRDHRVLAAWNIATDRLDRNIAVAEEDPRHCLDFDIGHRRSLGFGKFADLSLGKPDVVHVASRHLVDCRLDLGRGQSKRGRREVVEFRRQVAYCGVASGFDVLERRFDKRPDFGVILGAFGGRLPLFHIAN